MLLAEEMLLSQIPEALGLLALLLLHDSRRKARVGSKGELVLLEEQDRSLWDQKDPRNHTNRTNKTSLASVVSWIVHLL